MTDVETRGTFEILGDVMRDLRVAEDELRAEHDAALRRYVERVDAILAFGIPTTEHPDDEDHSPFHLVQGLRERLSELRVRAHLGAKDAEDLIDRVQVAARRLTS